jgi:hypothetical protein
MHDDGHQELVPCRIFATYAHLYAVAREIEPSGHNEQTSILGVRLAIKENSLTCGQSGETV